MTTVKPFSKLPAADQALLSSAISSIPRGDIAGLSAIVPELVSRGLLNYPNAYPLDRTLLNVALSSRIPGIVAVLLDAGADITIPDYRQVTPLMKASMFDLGLVDALLLAKADIALRDKFGETALHHASRSILASVDILLRLIGEGADPNAADSAGRTPLHLAVGIVDPAKVRLLLERGSDPGIQAKGTLGTPLHYLQHTVHDLPSTTALQRQECIALLSP